LFFVRKNLSAISFKKQKPKKTLNAIKKLDDKRFFIVFLIKKKRLYWRVIEFISRNYQLNHKETGKNYLKNRLVKKRVQKVEKFKKIKENFLCFVCVLQRKFGFGGRWSKEKFFFFLIKMGVKVSMNFCRRFLFENAFIFETIRVRVH